MISAIQTYVFIYQFFHVSIDLELGALPQIRFAESVQAHAAAGFEVRELGELDVLVIERTIAAEQTGAARALNDLGWHLLTNVAFEHFVVDSGNVLSILNANDLIHWDARLVIWVVVLVLLAKFHEFRNASFLEDLFAAFVILELDILTGLAKYAEDTFALDKGVCS